MNTNDCITASEAAAYLNVSMQTLYNWRKSGKLNACGSIQKIGRPTLLYYRAEVEQVGENRLVSFRDGTSVDDDGGISVDYPPDWTDEVQPDSLGDEDLWQLSMLLR